MSGAVELHRAEAPIYALCGLGETLHAGCGNGQVLTWHRSAPDRIRLSAQAPASVFSLATLPRDRLAIGTSEGELIVLDLLAGEAVQRMRAHQSALHAVQILDQDRLATAGADGFLRIWALDGGRWSLLRDIMLNDGKLRGLAVSGDGAMLAVACGDGAVRVLETGLFNETRTFDGHPGGATAVLFHPSKPLLLSGGKDGHLRAWGLSEKAPDLPALPAHRSTIYGIAASTDGRRFATASRDKSIKVWDAARLDLLHRIDRHSNGHGHSVNAVAWIDAGLFSGGDDRRLLHCIAGT